MNNTITIQETQLFSMAYECMPQKFSSYRYCNKLKEFGYTKKEIDNERHFKYLLRKCSRIGRIMWVKKQVTDNGIVQKQSTLHLDNKEKLELTVEMCVEFLKKKGAKIMMPVTEYKEI